MRKKIQGLLAAIDNVTTLAPLKQVYSLLDLTSLNMTDTQVQITSLCQKAYALKPTTVAAICVYPQFVAPARRLLQSEYVRIATVANFPAGTSRIDEVVLSIRESINAGANEIDVVFPYTQYLAGDKLGAQDFVRQCKAACSQDVLLKVILETGVFADLQTVADACQDVILAGADFIKTSTGKMAVGATLDVAAVMLFTIKEMLPNLNRSIGFKAAGGVRTLAQATQYIELAQRILGDAWVTPKTFRLGASQLCDVILEQAKHV